jgi:hypothetical protein
MRPLTTITAMIAAATFTLTASVAHARQGHGGGGGGHHHGGSGGYHGGGSVARSYSAPVRSYSAPVHAAPRVAAAAPQVHHRGHDGHRGRHHHRGGHGGYAPSYDSTYYADSYASDDDVEIVCYWSRKYDRRVCRPAD